MTCVSAVTRLTSRLPRASAHLVGCVSVAGRDWRRQSTCVKVHRILL